MMKKFAFVFALLVAVALISCNDDDDDRYYDDIVGRTWTGSVGLRADNGEPLFSSFRFGNDGFGTETQYFVSDDTSYRDYRFQWWWESRGDDDLVLDYGKFGISYMDDVRVFGDRMVGEFYLKDGAPGYRFSLYME